MSGEERNKIEQLLKEIGDLSLLIINRSRKDENWENAIGINILAKDIFSKIHSDNVEKN